MLRNISTRRSVTQKMEEIRRKVSAEISLSIIGNGAPGSPHSVLIRAQNSYLFNCGESTQKFIQGSSRLTRLSNLFFTSPQWKNIGGLIGFMLTSNSYAESMEKITLHGPPKIPELLKVSSFMSKPITPFDFTDSETFDDGCVRMNRISLIPSPSETYFSYICDFPDKPGFLQMEKCLELRIPPGPCFSKLKAGEDITLNDGTIVKPSDVLGPPSPGPVILIIECPTAEVTKLLLESDAYSEFQNGSSLERPISIVHMTPKELYDSREYKNFCELFSPEAIHINISAVNPRTMNEKAFRKQVFLNLLHEEIFPLATPNTDEEGIGAGTRVQLRPNKGISVEAVETLSREKVLEETSEIPDLDEQLKKLKESLSKLKVTDDRVYPEIVFLGTGSQQPTKERNTASILVSYSDRCHYILDCGEGTWGQMIDHFGLEKAQTIIRDLKAIYISHKHPDHHLGLFTILEQRQLWAGSEKLTLIGPPFLSTWLMDFSRIFHDLECNHVNAIDLLQERRGASEELLEELKLDELKTCFVEHCAHAFGVRLSSNGYSIVYSGDAEPSDSLVQLGQNCDLLIHEATFENGMEKQAKMKKHSTMSQAIEMGREMNAKFTLLTHFSQRYAKLPYLASQEAEKTVGFAFDHMKVTPKLMPLLPHFHSALTSIFHESMEEMRLSGVKRRRREEL